MVVDEHPDDLLGAGVPTRIPSFLDHNRVLGSGVADGAEGAGRTAGEVVCGVVEAGAAWAWTGRCGNVGEGADEDTAEDIPSMIVGEEG